MTKTAHTTGPKLSRRAIRILNECKDATIEKPNHRLRLLGHAEPYAKRGLLGWRSYDSSYDWSSGGYYITEAGRAALAKTEGRQS